MGVTRKIPQNDFSEFKIPGRICILGDKIDLSGLPVIAAAIDTLMTVKIRRLNKPIVKLYTENYKTGLEYKLGEKGDWDHLLKYWCAMIYRLKDRIGGGFEVIVDSNIPIGAGLSSSAAISIALARALNHQFNLGMNKMEIAELAYVTEHDDLGIMCGRMDQYAISFGGITFIKTGENPAVYPLSLTNLPVVVGDSKEDRQAKKILNSVKKRLKENDPVVHRAFDEIHKCVLKGRKALESSNYKEVGKLMNVQQKQENIIGAATAKLNALCEASINAGAFGAKQMGAGGGGCMVAVCPGKQKEVAEAINESGGKAWIFNIFTYKSGGIPSDLKTQALT
ncbi:MAG: mevalonate kinase [Promethearchaeota archaeon]